jgi:hypothetical protein
MTSAVFIRLWRKPRAVFHWWLLVKIVLNTSPEYDLPNKILLIWRKCGTFTHSPTECSYYLRNVLGLTLSHYP